MEIKEFLNRFYPAEWGNPDNILVEEYRARDQMVSLEFYQGGEWRKIVVDQGNNSVRHMRREGEEVSMTVR